jgi:hypothetical protein
MRSVLLACVVLALGLGHANAQRLADEPILDANKLPVFHGAATWTLGCADSNVLLRIKDELNGQPVRVETHARMAQMRCTIIPSSEPLRLWHEYTYVGISGAMHGPKLAQIITKSMDGLVLFVMRDEIVGSQGRAPLPRPTRD